jgi:hypothetical protein
VQMVAPPFSSDPIPHSQILKNLDVYSSVSHYWAAFLIAVHPNNNFDVWKDEDVAFTPEDSLHEFLENVDLASFLGHAYTFREFIKGYLHPKTKRQTKFSNKNSAFWLEPGPEVCPKVSALDIPDLWGCDYPFKRFQKHFDASNEKAARYNADRYRRERKSQNN